jgi:hypothetical protein
MANEQLPGMRFCDPPASIEDTPLERRVSRLYEELSARGMPLTVKT